jgi:hypothetical protein
MNLTVAVKGELKKYAEQELRAAGAAVNFGLRKATGLHKGDMRRQVRRARFKREATSGKTDIANTWRSELQLKGDIDKRRGSVFTKWKAMLAFEQGAVIRAAGGKWLAVPAKAIGYIGNRRVRLKDLQHLRLAFVRTKRPDLAMLVQRGSGGQKDEVMFWLLKQVRVRKRLDHAGSAEKRGDELPGFVIDEWERQAERQALKQAGVR